MSKDKPRHNHVMKKKLTTKERKAINHLKLIQGKGQSSPVSLHNENTNNNNSNNTTNQKKDKKAA